MTKILHYVSSINHRDEFVWVKFQEITTPAAMAVYLASAQTSWTEQGLPGKIPQNTIEHLRRDRFKNEFEMKFPFSKWSKRNLLVHDKVEIDMPLQLTDIVTVGTDEGI